MIVETMNSALGRDKNKRSLSSIPIQNNNKEHNKHNTK